MRRRGEMLGQGAKKILFTWAHEIFSNVLQLFGSFKWSSISEGLHHAVFAFPMSASPLSVLRIFHGQSFIGQPGYPVGVQAVPLCCLFSTSWMSFISPAPCKEVPQTGHMHQNEPQKPPRHYFSGHRLFAPHSSRSNLTTGWTLTIWLAWYDHNIVFSY